MGILAASWLVWLFGGQAVKDAYVTQLALTPDGVFREGRVWQLVTAPFVYPTGNAVMQLLLDALVIWMMTLTEAPVFCRPRPVR